MPRGSRRLAFSLGTSPVQRKKVRARVHLLHEATIEPKAFENAHTAVLSKGVRAPSFAGRNEHTHAVWKQFEHLVFKRDIIKRDLIQAVWKQFEHLVFKKDLIKET